MKKESAPRRTSRGALAAAGAMVASLGLAVMAQAGTVIPSGFEADDGNLTVQSTFDWNGFAPTTWTGTAPYRESEKDASGWHFKGFEDAGATNTDTAFSGGVKQDMNCPGTNAGKAPNKDDLERIYLSSKDVPGFDDGEGGTESHTILNLAWVRIPQNTTSASAHVAFEFNKGETACPDYANGDPNPLVQRTAGDMLVVYDFQGGDTDAPVITLRRWVTSGSCEVGSSSPPCWGPAANLTTLGYAEAKVFVGTSTFDAIAPTPENVGDREFGEAGLDLTAAGVFTAGTCEAFGSVTGASRSSGNSGTAQMKDRVGPGDFTLTNCGIVHIIKHTDPRGVDQDFEFTSTLAGSEIECTADETPAAFTLNDSGNTTEDSEANTETCINVPAGSYTVTEGADPSGFAFDSLSCEWSGTGTSATTDGKVASITVAGGGEVTCTYVNKQQQGAIEITKTRKHAAAEGGEGPHAGVTFTIAGNGVDEDVVTGSDGTVCLDGLVFGAYTVTETVPDGYVSDDAVKEVTVDENSTCDTGTPESVTFVNTPLTDVTVSVTSQVEGGTASTIRCVDASDVVVEEDLTNAPGDVSVTAEDLLPTAPTATLICTIVVDP